MRTASCHRPPTPCLGIITGSCAEAGIDLWQKILAANRSRMGPAYRGDIDAPMVHVISVPRIGGNYRPLEADDNYEKVWSSLKQAILDLAPHVSVFVVACTTLHEYADRIEALRLTPQFLSYVEVVERFLVGISPESIVGVIGPQWTAMDDCGIYSPWQQVCQLELQVRPSWS
eukprot:TRINITY_DN2889_c0_g1_i4.p1 TRINITY_DN2889_c0_g1~~TRINITY_DN2889_c0_g1_i4.p1  ORF type:complete len:173 (-),score=21.00 TRINITY_DN2889_c0_g1_i4:673-1191(-)